MAFFLRLALIGLLVSQGIPPFIPYTAYAVDSRVNVSGFQQTTALVVSDLRITEPKIISHDGDNLSLSFAFVNGNIAQSNMQFAIRLFKETPQGQVPAAETVFPEKIDLTPGASAQKSITYTLPVHEAGNFSLWVEARNVWGTPIAIAGFGAMALTKSETVPILLTHCMVRVGDAQTKEWSPTFGVDVEKTERLFLVCDVQNEGQNARDAYASFITHERDSFGPIVSVPTPDQNLSLSVGTTTDFIIPVSIAQKPQAYTVDVMLVDAKHIQISNTISMHYVVRGESATIQYAYLDRPDYRVGDIAAAEIYVTPSADNFPDARGGGTATIPLIVSFFIVDARGTQCSNIVDMRIDPQNRENFIQKQVPITKECAGAVIVSTVKNLNGDILYSRAYAFATSTWAFPWPVSSAIVIVLFIVLAVGGGVFMWLKRKRSGPDSAPPHTGTGIVIAVLIMSGAYAFLPSPVSADSFIVRGGTPKDTLTYPDVVTSCNAVPANSQCVWDVLWPAGQSNNGIENARLNQCSRYKISDFYGYSCKPGTPASGLFSITVNAIGATGNDATYTVNLDKSVYAPGETITLSASTLGSYCSNGYTFAWLTADSEGTWKQIIKNQPTGTIGVGWQDSVPTYAAVQTFTAPPSPGTHTIRVYGFAYIGHFFFGSVASYDLSYTVVSDDPVIDMSADPSSVSCGDPATIRWTAYNANSCTASGAWSGNRATSGTEVIYPDRTSRTYTLSCTNDHGTVSKSITVPACVEPVRQCSDGIDNDGDGKIDYGSDPDCLSATDDNETTVPDFILHNSTDLKVDLVGGSPKSNSANISVWPDGGFSSDVALSALSMIPNISGITYSIGDPNLSSSEYIQGSTFSVSVPPNVPSGTYTITIRGVGNGLIRSLTVPLIVNGKKLQFQEF